MKNFILASAIALMGVASNAFAEDDGYGNDMPVVAEEVNQNSGDGYGNSTPEDKGGEFKSFANTNTRDVNGTKGPFGFGAHVDVGLAGYWDYPSKYIGKNDWFGAEFDLGFVFKYRFNQMFSVAPEVNFGVNFISRELSSGYSWGHGEYSVKEVRTLYSINLPILGRFNPTKQFFLEAGMDLNFILGTGHSVQATADDGYSDSEDIDEWEASSFIPSLVVGLGGIFEKAGHEYEIGLRFVLDLSSVHKWNKYLARNDAGDFFVVTDNTKIWAVQLVMSYYFI